MDSEFREAFKAGIIFGKEDRTQKHQLREEEWDSGNPGNKDEDTAVKWDKKR